MTGFSVDKDGKQTGGLEQWATSLGKMVGSVKGLWQQLETGKKKFDAMNAVAGKSKSSFSDYIKYISESEDATEAFGIATLYTRARVLLLNMALSTGLALAASLIVKKIAEASQSIETNAMKSKEAADAAQSTASSLKDLVNAYEELGDKSGWGTEDFDQAKDIQAEILDLAKEQGTLDENKLGKLDLQNGKYEEQLAILKDITSEQLKASQKELVQSKDAQGTKLIQTAKKNNRSHMFGTIWSNAEMQMGDQIKDAGIDVFNWAGGYGADDINDADSIVDYYNNLGKAIEYIIDNTTDEERAVNGKYHALYQFLMDERNALKDDVDSYNDSISALKQNQFKSDFAEWSANETKKSTQATSEIDAKIKATKEYQDAVKEAQKTEEEWNSQGYGKYGNIDNFHRDKIDWTEENLAKYKDFVDEQNSIFPGTIEKGSYSTVLGSWDTISDEDGTEHPFAFTPMLQTDSGLVPLTEDQLWNYIDTIVEQCYDENGKLDVDKLMELDATGLKQDINGVMMQVKGMIAGVAGGKNPNGGVYSAADVLALSGDSNEDIKNDLIDLYGPDADLTPVDDNGNLSRYVGKSMHDAQAVAQEGKDNIEAVYNQLYNDLENGSSGESDGSSSAPVRYVDHIKSAFEILADSLGKDAGEMTISDVVGLSQDGVQLTDEQAQALDTLTAAANKYGTTIQGVAEAGEENGLFGGIENAVNGVSSAIQQMETISQNIDNIQSAYKNATTAIDEYNKYGYLSADTLQTLLDEDFEYLSCLELVDGQLQVNTEKYQGMIAAQYQSAAMALVEKANAELAKIAQGEKKDAVEDATKATEDQATALTERVCPALGEFAKASMTAAAAQEFLANGDAAWSVDPERTKEVYAGLASGLNILDATVDQIMGNSDKFRQHMNGFDKETKNRNKNTAKSVTDVASAFDTLNKAMKEYNQYGYLCADTAKSLVGLDDKFTACLTKQGNKLQINVEQFRKFVKEQLKEANAAKDGGKSADEMNKILNYLDQNVDTTTISFEQLTDAIKGYGTAMDEAKEKTDAIKSAFSDLYDVGTQKKDNDFGFLDMDAIEKQYQAVRNLYENTDLFTNPKYASALNSETGEVDYNSDAFKQMFADHLKELAASARETGGAAGEYLAQGFEDAAAKIANNVMSIRECIDGIGSSLNYATDRIDHFQSGFSDISDIVTQYNTYGGLSIDNYQKLMSLDDDYIKCLSLEGNQLKFNTEAYKELFIAKLNAMIDEYDAADETKALAQRLRELRDAVIASGDGFTGAEDKAKNFETTLGNIKSLLSDLIGVFEKFNENKSNDLKIQGDAWIDVIDKRIDALNEENDAQERAIELAKLQDEYERAKANKTVHVYGGRGQGFVWKADENAVREAGQNLSDKQREYKKKDEIDRLNKLKDKVQEANSLIGTSWDDYQKKLKYTAEFEAMTFEQMEGHYDGFKNSILDNMRDIQSATNVSNAITNLEKLINTLKTLNNVITFFTSGGVSTDGGGIFGLFRNLKNMFTGESGDFDLGAGFKKMFDGAAKAVSDGWNWITGKNRAGSAALKSDTTATLDILGNTINVNTGDIQRVSGGFFERLVGAAKDNLGSIGKFFSGA